MFVFLGVREILMLEFLDVAKFEFSTCLHIGCRSQYKSFTVDYTRIIMGLKCPCSGPGRSISKSVYGIL